MGLSFNGEEGQYNFYCTGTYHCSCIGPPGGGGGTAGYGGGQYTLTYKINLHYRLSEILAGLDRYTLNPDSVGRRCSHTSLRYSAPSGTPFDMTDTGFFYQSLALPSACVTFCSSGKKGAVAGPSGSATGEANCRNEP